LAQAGLQLGGSEQELISAWCICQGVCAILWLSASTLPSFALPVHLNESLQKKLERESEDAPSKLRPRGNCKGGPHVRSDIYARGAVKTITTKVMYICRSAPNKVVAVFYFFGYKNISIISIFISSLVGFYRVFGRFSTR
jgi:hypothetical protein